MRTRTIGLLLVLILLACPSQQAEAQSPSLGWLVYIRGNELWVKELPEGRPQQVTQGGHNESPRWSPSGEWIAYRHENQAWIVRRSGADAKALNDASPVRESAWSPATDKLAYTTPNGSLHVVSASGSDDMQLVVPADRENSGVWNFAWSPDGKWIAYGRIDTLNQATPIDRYTSLMITSADGSETREVLNFGRPSQDGLVVAGWTPDNASVLFWPDYMFSASLLADGVPLQAIPKDGGTTRSLVKGMLLYQDFMTVSPDQQSMAVVEGGYRGAWTGKHIVVVNPATGEKQQLTGDSVAASSPAWSPNGRQIAYVAMPEKGDLGGGFDAKAGLMQRRIWVMNRDGSGKHQVTNDANYRDERPQWSADGGHILFARIYSTDAYNDDKDRADIWLMRADGGNLRQILTGISVNDNYPYSTSVAPIWFGYYGHIVWERDYDWWRGTMVETTLPVGGGSPDDLSLWLAIGALMLLVGLGIVVFGQISKQQIHKGRT